MFAAVIGEILVVQLSTREMIWFLREIPSYVWVFFVVVAWPCCVTAALCIKGSV